MTDANKTEGLAVSLAENGMKLLRFLERRLGLPQSALHRWIRTGQVRINGKRAKPFDLLTNGDTIRIPPFALAEFHQSEPQKAVGNDNRDELFLPPIFSGSLPVSIPAPAKLLNSGTASILAMDALSLIQLEDNILVLHKKTGLPSQPGSNWSDSASTRLASLYEGQSFIPAPAHRLDRQSSGILLAGRTHMAQKYLHEVLSGEFADEKNAAKEKLIKEYLVWVSGIWPWHEELICSDWLSPVTGPDGMEKMTVLDVPSSKAQYAECRIKPLSQKDDLFAGLGATLLKVILLTGRKHQIRIQCAHRGHPVVGDTRYGWRGQHKTLKKGELLLHAWRVTLPDGHIFTQSPDWQVPFNPPAI